MTVQISIDLDLDVYRALVVQADRCDTQVHKLVSAAVTNAMRNGARRKDTPLQKQVRERHRAGANDAEIARELDKHTSTIRRIRDKLGLPPNAPPGRPRTKAAS